MNQVARDESVKKRPILNFERVSSDKTQKGDFAMKRLFQRFWCEEDAQGATEYILILVVVVILATLFKDQITEAVQQQLNNLGTNIRGFE